MKFIDSHPDFQNLKEEDLISKIPPTTLMSILFDVAEYYNSQLRMSNVYSIYGYSLDDTGDQQQIPCLLPTHGTYDRHPSSRFYATDRNTGEKKHAIFCFKCQRTVTPFWLLFMREQTRGLKTRDLFTFIYQRFRILFPRTILFNFDADTYYLLEESEALSKIKKIEQAQTLLLLKQAKDPLYLSMLKRFFQEG